MLEKGELELCRSRKFCENFSTLGQGRLTNSQWSSNVTIFSVSIVKSEFYKLAGKLIEVISKQKEVDKF